MKKLLTLLLSFSIVIMPAYCAITDDFAEKNLDKNLKININTKKDITDDFVNNSLDKTLKIKNTEPKLIIDNFAENNKNKNGKIQKYGLVSEILPKAQETKSIVINKNAYSDSLSPVEVAIKKEFSTKQKVEEGDYLEFVTKSDINTGKHKFPKGTTVKARVENVSLNEAMGVPSDLVIGNFTINGVPLRGEINKVGANRSLWVYPCTYGLMFFFGAGLVFAPIRGGHAKINPTEVFTLYVE